MTHTIAIPTSLLQRFSLLASALLLLFVLSACSKPAEKASVETGQTEIAAIESEHSAEGEEATGEASLKSGEKIDGSITPPNSELIAEIEKCDNLIVLFEKTLDYKKLGKLSADIASAIEAKHSSLLSQTKIYNFGGKIDLLAAGIRSVGPGQGEVCLLLRPKVQLESDYKIGINAYVDESHKDMLSPQADKKNMLENWAFWPKPGSREWKANTEILVKSEAPLKPIPYRLSVGFYANDPPHRLGENLQLGWVANIE